MFKPISLSLIFVLLMHYSGFGQSATTRSQVMTLQPVGVSNPVSKDAHWRPILTNKCVEREPRVPDHDKLERLKAEKARQKYAAGTSSREVGMVASAPVVGSNWLGNTNTGYSPMDNSIAISDGGIIVSVANNSLLVTDITGTVLYFNDIVTFFNDPGITSVCDPVVLYDRPQDKFIFFFQECSGNSSNTHICICFSQTNNPASGGWWNYKLTGDPQGAGVWFDYPKMAVSNDELFITGNMFSNAGVFSQALVFQIEKNPGYTGGNINWNYWFNINNNPFTLLPGGNGFGQSPGTGCWFVATSAAGASDIKVYHITGNISSTPSMTDNLVSTTAYSPAADADQLGTSCKLDNGDCRALSGFVLNGIFHFVFHSDAGQGWNGINYNRLNLTTLTNTSSIFGQAGQFDLSYPAVASLSTSTSDKSVMIGFGRSSSTIFPEIRAVNCDNNMNWSTSSLVHSSTGYVSFTSSSTERWGDYTGMCRKHNSATPSVWMLGMFGNSSHTWDSWVAEVHGSTTGIEETNGEATAKIFPNPAIDIFSFDVALNQPQVIRIMLSDETGRLVKELYSGKAPAGENSFSFNSGMLSAGTYLISVSNDEKIFIRKKLVVRPR
ncbi:MAG: T9SS type A sorting domain-containing protein [Bacteroidia bacterium]